MVHRKTQAGLAVLDERRRQLMDATAQMVCEKGLSHVTLAHIAARAGISVGSVGFYFGSKDELLRETLRSVAVEYYGFVSGVVEAAGEDPAARMRALVLAATDPDAVTLSTAAVWYAFMAEAKSRSEYMDICDDGDQQYVGLVVQTCRQLAAAAPRPPAADPEVLAHAIVGLIELVWQEVLYASGANAAEAARARCLAFLPVAFPWAFSAPETTFGRPRIPVDVRPAVAADIDQLLPLIDGCRQGAGVDPLPADGRRFLAEHLASAGALLFVAVDGDGRLRGFASGLEIACPVRMSRRWVVREIHVEGELRRGGVGSQLLENLLVAARERGVDGVDVETGDRDYLAGLLSEKLGFAACGSVVRYSRAAGLQAGRHAVLAAVPE